MKKKFIIILLLMLMGVCPAGCGSAQEYISEQLERGVEDKGQNVSENDAAVTVPEKREVFVHISGAVKKPGVYSLSDGSRLSAMPFRFSAARKAKSQPHGSIRVIGCLKVWHLLLANKMFLLCKYDVCKAQVTRLLRRL